MVEMAEKLITESVGLIFGNYRNEHTVLIFFLTSNSNRAVINVDIHRFFSVGATF